MGIHRFHCLFRVFLFTTMMVGVTHIQAEDRGLNIVAKAVGGDNLVIGKQYAVLIGIDKYQEWNPLRNPVKDALSFSSPSFAVKRTNSRPGAFYSTFTGLRAPTIPIPFAISTNPFSVMLSATLSPLSQSPTQPSFAVPSTQGNASHPRKPKPHSIPPSLALPPTVASTAFPGGSDHAQAHDVLTS